MEKESLRRFLNRYLDEANRENKSYIKIGTAILEMIIENLEESNDKQNEKLPVNKYKKRYLDSDDDGPKYAYDVYFDCANCGQRLSRTNTNKTIKYCWNCGQAQDWEI